MGEGHSVCSILYVKPSWKKSSVQFSFVSKHDTKWHGYNTNPKKRYISPIYEEHAVRKKSKFKIQKRNSILETQIVFQIVKESLNRKKKMYLWAEVDIGLVTSFLIILSTYLPGSSWNRKSILTEEIFFFFPVLNNCV